MFVGIDFGAFAIQDLALRHPERVQAIICLENPAAPHNPDKSPLTEYREMGEQHFLHIEYFREPPRADLELAAAPRSGDTFTLAANGRVLVVDSLQGSDEFEHRAFAA